MTVTQTLDAPLPSDSGAQPWVTLVTPAFNQGEFLAETIDSVLAQDYPHLEYIVLDDGSTDNTQAVLARYASRVCTDRHENIGQSATLNRGWSMARGALIGYLSSDDLLEPQAVSSLVAALQAHPAAVVAYGDFWLIDAKSRKFRQVQAEDYDERRLRIDLICQPGPGALIRRAVFDETGGWATHLRQVPDFEFWLRASRRGPFVRVNESLARYRIHDGSASLRPISSARSAEIVQVMQSFWSAASSTDAASSISTAHLLAARSHAQSGRFTTALGEMLKAVRLQPAAALSWRAWRAILAGTFRRLAYRLSGVAR